MCVCVSLRNIISSGRTLRLNVSTDHVVAIPWMPGWNGISSVRMGADEKLWLVAEQDPRPRFDRARHVTSQVYWVATGQDVGRRSRRGHSQFFPTQPLPQEDLHILLANANALPHEHHQRSAGDQSQPTRCVSEEQQQLSP